VGIAAAASRAMTIDYFGMPGHEIGKAPKNGYRTAAG
jgi:hypothetical protein